MSKEQQNTQIVAQDNNLETLLDWLSSLDISYWTGVIVGLASLIVAILAWRRPKKSKEPKTQISSLGGNNVSNISNIGNVEKSNNQNINFVNIIPDGASNVIEYVMNNVKEFEEKHPDVAKEADVTLKQTEEEIKKKDTPERYKLFNLIHSDFTREIIKESKSLMLAQDLAREICNDLDNEAEKSKLARAILLLIYTKIALPIKQSTVGEKFNWYDAEPELIIRAFELIRDKYIIRLPQEEGSAKHRELIYITLEESIKGMKFQLFK